jgi:hypothetical protein
MLNCEEGKNKKPGLICNPYAHNYFTSPQGADKAIDLTFTANCDGNCPGEDPAKTM